MSLGRAFTLSAIVLAAIAFASLALAANISPWVTSLGGVAFAVCLARTLPVRVSAPWLEQTVVSPATWNILLVVAFLGFWIDLLWLSQELLPAGIHFLIVLIVNKLFNLYQRRDYLHLYSVSLMAILASAALTTRIWYAALLVLFAIAGVWTLLLYHLTQERDETAAAVGLDGRMSTTPTITPRFFCATMALAGIAVCLAGSLFFVIPRVGGGFLQTAQGESLRMTGFTEKVDLGAMGPVKQDSSIVMRVERTASEGQDREPLYLRGMAYDRYNGHSWSNGALRRRNLAEKPQGTFTTGASSKGGTSEIRQNILLEALDTGVLFGAPQVVSLSGDLLTVQSDAMGVLYIPFSPPVRLRYSVRSRPADILPADASEPVLTYPEPLRRQYLQLPPLNPEIARLAGKVVQNSATPLEAVLSIKRHLLESYRYSLEIPAGRSAHPLDDFLFTRKSGYCEHYATAMVVMLRSIGIPARLVTGFLANEWNGFGNYYTVRQRDAHAWVEVYFPASGWITFDPTPPEPVSGGARWWQSWAGPLDSLRLQWEQLVVQYNAADQLSVMHGVRDNSDLVRRRMAAAISDWWAALKAYQTLVAFGTPVVSWPSLIVILLMGAGAVLVAALLRDRAKRRLGLAASGSPQHRMAVRWYGEMLELAAVRGHHKLPSQTPLEFVRQVEHRWHEGSPYVGQLTHLYCRVRFGQGDVTEEDLRAAESALGALRHDVRSVC